MTYPPAGQDNTQTPGSQPTAVSGSIIELEYKPEGAVEEKEQNKQKPKRRGLKIFAVFAALMLLIIILMGILALYLLWPNPQVMELEEVEITVQSDTGSFRHWKVSGKITNIHDKALDVSLIRIKIYGTPVAEPVTEDLTRVCTDAKVTTGEKTDLQPEMYLRFTAWAPVEESTQSTRPILKVKILYDGEESDIEEINVGGKW